MAPETRALRGAAPAAPPWPTAGGPPPGAPGATGGLASAGHLARDAQQVVVALRAAGAPLRRQYLHQSLVQPSRIRRQRLHKPACAVQWAPRPESGTAALRDNKANFDASSHILDI